MCVEWMFGMLRSRIQCECALFLEVFLSLRVRGSSVHLTQGLIDQEQQIINVLCCPYCIRRRSAEIKIVFRVVSVL